MKRTTTIVLFASIFAVGTLGLSGSFATTLMVAAPQSPELVGMLGHVEYKVLDYSGNIVKYMQSDNVVVNDGEDCAAEAIFGQGVGGDCVGTVGTNNFDFISIGNGSSGNIDPTNSTLSDMDSPGVEDDVGVCAISGPTGGGDMARRQVVPTHTAASGTSGAVVVLDTSGIPFTFDSSNATVVIDSGVFNAFYQSASLIDVCVGTAGSAGVDWDMFSRQLLNGVTGITVNDGDSLSVKWTITVG